MELTENIAESERFLTSAEVCALFNVAPHVLRRWRVNGGGPRFFRLGHRTVRYRIEDVREWLTLKALA